MNKSTDITVRETELFFLPTHLRVPLKFGAQVVTQALCARVRVRLEDRQGRSAEGWGETPLSVAWVWPSKLSWEDREQRMTGFTKRLAEELPKTGDFGHPMELGHRFHEHRLEKIRAELNARHSEELPHLAALVCHSLFDLAVYDAFGNLHGRPVFETLVC